MARFYGEVGYGISVETAAGVWQDAIVRRSYYGDVVRNTRRLDSGDKVNDDISVGNSIEIVADDEIIENFHAIRYVEWMGKRWKVPNVEVRRPRLLLTLGDIYNGPTT